MGTMIGSIFLVGPMGVGKTTIGKCLAQCLAMPFVDSDKEIEHRTGASIPLIFELEGESGFRKRECEIIDELTQRQGIILATGGGVVLHEENRTHLRRRGQVIYLRAPLRQLLKRTANNRNRPLLQTTNPAERLRQILEERDPLYNSIADVIVETGSRSVKTVINKILQQLQMSTHDLN